MAACGFGTAISLVAQGDPSPGCPIQCPATIGGCRAIEIWKSRVCLLQAPHTLVTQSSNKYPTKFLRAATSHRTVLVFFFPFVFATAPLPAAQPIVSAHQDGTNIVIHFSGRLQRASRVDGPYKNVAGASSPHLTSLSESSQQFWRSAISDVRTIATSSRHMLAIRNDGTLWAWGDNRAAQLGIGTISTDIPLGAYEPVQVGT